MKYRLDPLSPTGVSPVQLTPTQIAMSVGGSSGGDTLWEVNTYGSIDYLQPITTTQGLVIGADLHSSIPSAFTTVSAVFNGDTATGNTGLNYFMDVAYGTDGFAFGAIFLGAHAGGTPSSPTQIAAGNFLGALAFTAYSGSAWSTSGSNHVLSGFWAQAAADVTTTLEQNIWIGGVITPMIYFETDTNVLQFNQAQVDSDITFYYDGGAALAIDGGTGDITSGTVGTVANSLANIDTAQTFTNKRITPRVSSEASSATPTINTDTTDCHSITALATAITSMTTNLSGTPTNFQKLIIRIKDNGTARAITWGASFEAKGVPLPTTTVISKVLTVVFLYDTVTSKWGCVTSVQEA